MNTFKMSKIGADTAQLTDEEIEYIEQRVIAAQSAPLVARQIFAPVELANAGARTWTSYLRGKMAAARIDMDGLNKSFDRSKKTAQTVNVPVLHKDFMLFWRDILASRNGGLQSLDVTEAENAAQVVAELEDKLLLTGEYTGFRALGVEGLSTATNRNTEASAGAWSTATNALQDIIDARSELRADGFYGPYALVVRSDMDGDLDGLISGVGRVRSQLLGSDGILAGGKIFVSDNLYTSGGATTSAVLCQPGRDNFVVGIAQDISVRTKEDEDWNLKGQAFEVVAPKIYQPTSICEITGITP